MRSWRRGNRSRLPPATWPPLDGAGHRSKPGWFVQKTLSKTPQRLRIATGDGGCRPDCECDFTGGNEFEERESGRVEARPTRYLAIVSNLYWIIARRLC